MLGKLEILGVVLLQGLGTEVPLATKVSHRRVRGVQAR